MIKYVDYEYYNGTWKEEMGEVSIPQASFNKWSIKASNEIKYRTFGNIGLVVPESVKLCTCELAEHLYSCSQRDIESDNSVSSEKDGSWSVSYKNRTLIEKEDSEKADSIINNWLLSTGLLYCGV